MTVTTFLENTQCAKIRLRTTMTERVSARAHRYVCLRYCGTTSHETIEAQELPPRKLLHKPSKIRSGVFGDGKSDGKDKFQFDQTQCS